MSAASVEHEHQRRRQVEYVTSRFPHNLFHNPVTRWMICGIILLTICIGIPIVLYWILEALR